MRNNVLNESDSSEFEERRPAPGFAVVGRGREALAGIHQVVVDGKEPQHTFSSKDDLSLVFFTLSTGVGPRLIKARRVGNTIELYYVLPSNGRLGISAHLYIIPVGKLPPGEYEVNPRRAYEEEPKFSAQSFESYERGIEQSFVCKPFNFVVLENSSSEKETK